MRQQSQDDEWKSLIQLLLMQAMGANANCIKANFHKCAQYDGWCVEITLKKHDICDVEEGKN